MPMSWSRSPSKFGLRYLTAIQLPVSPELLVVVGQNRSGGIEE
jgi:hypothetical protein